MHISEFELLNPKPRFSHVSQLLFGVHRVFEWIFSVRSPKVRLSATGRIMGLSTETPKPLN